MFDRVHAEVIEVIRFNALQKQLDRPFWRTFVSFQNKSRFGDALFPLDRSAGYLCNFANMENDTSNQQQIGPKEQIQYQQA